MIVMTDQEVFTKIAAHLLKQGEKSVDDRGRCRYHGPNGLKCAAGCLIPDGSYVPEMEGQPASDLFLRRYPGIYVGGSESLLDNLQLIHDEMPVAAWERELRTEADVHGLKWEL